MISIWSSINDDPRHAHELLQHIIDSDYDCRNGVSAKHPDDGDWEHGKFIVYCRDIKRPLNCSGVQKGATDIANRVPKIATGAVAQSMAMKDEMNLNIGRVLVEASKNTRSWNLRCICAFSCTCLRLTRWSTLRCGLEIFHLPISNVPRRFKSTSRTQSVLVMELVLV